jgi:hypothetical protein
MRREERRTRRKKTKAQLARLSIPGNGSLPRATLSGRGRSLSVVKAAPLGKCSPNSKSLSFQFEDWVIGPDPQYSEKRTNAKRPNQNVSVRTQQRTPFQHYRYQWTYFSTLTTTDIITERRVWLASTPASYLESSGFKYRPANRLP